MAKRINVRALREAHGMTIGDVARHVYGQNLDSKTLDKRKRTVRRWENEGRTPNTLAADRLRELDAKRPAKTRRSAADEGDDTPTPVRRPVSGGLLPSMESD